MSESPWSEEGKRNAVVGTTVMVMAKLQHEVVERIRKNDLPQSPRELLQDIGQAISETVEGGLFEGIEGSLVDLGYMLSPSTKKSSG